MKSPMSPLTFLTRSSSSSPASSLLSYSTSSSVGNSENSYCEFQRNVRVAVWWDLENCSIPNGVNALRVTKNITAAIRANGIKGPVSITAFGDFMQFSRSTQENLSITGVSLNHVPSGGNNSSDRSLLADLVFWVSENPPPAHLFLISGDKDFASILHRLRMNNYNILLASNAPAPGVLCSASSIMWNWYELVRGENFSGKHFNEPPDGIIESWYDHQKMPLQVSIPDVGHLSQVPTQDDHKRYDHKKEPLEKSIPDVGQPAQVPTQDDVTGSTTCAVPRAIVKQIREVVIKYPGVDMSLLPVELQKNNVELDKKYYGYKKLSLLLQSFPTVFELRSVGSKVCVYCHQKKIHEAVAQSKALERVDRLKADKKLECPKIAEVNNSKPKIVVDSDAKDSDKSTVVPVELKRKENPTTADVNGNLSLPHSTPEIHPCSSLQKENDVQPTEEQEQNDSTSTVGFEGMWRNLFGRNSEASNGRSNESTEVCSEDANLKKKEQIVSTSVSSSKESPISERNEEENSSSREGMLPKILKWCRSWKTNTSLDAKSEDFVKQVNNVNNQTCSEELFSKATFWEDLFSFLKTQEGSSLITHSITREQMVYRMQNEGPPSINAICEADLIRLVDLLISDKKWVEQGTDKLFPFRLTLPATPAPTQPSIIPKETICSATAVSGKPKAELLADCQKHLSELLKANPTGINMSLVKTSFLEKFEYELPHQELGYPKLSSFLQTFPEVAFDHNYIVPSKLSPKVVIPYEEDGLWNELGPISERKSDSKPDRNYHSDDSDDERMMREVTSRKELMGILGTWKKDGEHEGLDVDCSKINLRPSLSDISGVSSFQGSRGEKKMHYPRRTINFVSDSSETDKKG